MNKRIELADASRAALKSLPTTSLLLASLISVNFHVHSAIASPPTPAEALSLKPVQSGITYDMVPMKEQENCTVRDLMGEDWGGWEVIAPDGERLRVFADTNGDKKVDLWCYFSSGIEVYRDIDEDFNGKADQYRWLGIIGTKWGLDENEDGNIDRWKVISPEELSDETIKAIGNQDLNAFQAILATPDDLEIAGLSAVQVESLTVRLTQASKGFPAFAKNQTQITNRTEWLQFAGQGPGTLPKSDKMVSKDIVVYDSAVALYQTPSVSDSIPGQIYLGPLLRVGENWRLLGLPTFDEQQALTDPQMSFFGSNAVANLAGIPTQTMTETTEKLVNQLEGIDKLLMGDATTAGSQEQIADLNRRRADILEQLMNSSESSTDKNAWARQLIDMLAISAQTSDYPTAARRLGKLANRLDAENSSSRDYAKFQSITTDYLVNQLASDDFAAVQRAYIGQLNAFVKDFPDSPQAAEAWKQLALQKEFENENEAAISIYQEIVSRFPGSAQAEIAEGAIRRMDSVGKRIDLRGKTLDGVNFQLSNLRGKLVVLHYWATWCSPCLQDMRALQQLQSTYRNAKFEIIGINVDMTAAKTRQHLQQTKIPWIQLFEAGGLEGSGLSKALGIQTLPAMLLIDEDGRVVSNNLQVTDLQQELARRFR